MSTGALLALTAVSAGMSVVQGIQQQSACNKAGIAYMQQAQTARRENELAIQQKQREIDKTAARQVMAMAKNGMDTGRGTPLEILQETAFLGQQEVDALRLQGEAQVGYYNALGKQQFNNGRTALLGGMSDALTTVAATGIKMKTNNMSVGTNSSSNSGISVGTKSLSNSDISWGTAASGSTIGNMGMQIFAPNSSGLA